MQFFHRISKLFIIFGVHRINPRKNHWFHIFKTLNAICCWIFCIRQRITNFYFFRFFNSRNQIPNITSRNNRFWNLVQFQSTNFVRKIFISSSHKFNFLTFFDLSVFHTKNNFNSTKRIVMRIKNQSLQWLVNISFWRRNSLDNRRQNIFDTQTSFTRSVNNFF